MTAPWDRFFGWGMALFLFLNGILPIPSALADEPPSPVTPPLLLQPVTPVYPPDAANRGEEAEVTLKLVLDAAGQVTEVSVVTSGGPLFDASAQEAARELRFSPGLAQGHPVPFQVEYTFSFRLSRVDHPPEMAEGTALLRGKVVDAETGAALASALVSITGQESAVETAADGTFTLPGLAPGRMKVVVFKEGHSRLVEAVELRAGEALTMQFSLPTGVERTNVTVVRGRAPWREVERAPLLPGRDEDIAPSVVLTRRDLDYLPGAMEDVAQAVGKVAGVASDALLGGFWIRGGEVTDTSYFLDRVSLMDPYHLGGYVSQFNPELIQQAEVYLGAPPATLRSGLAGALVVDYVEGTSGRWDGVIDISMATFKAHLSGSLGKEGRTTFVLGARRSYLELYFGILQLAGVFPTSFPAPSYGEVYGKVTHRLSDRHTLSAFAMVGESSLRFSENPEGDESLVQLGSSFALGGPSLVAAVDWAWRGEKATSQATLYFQWMRTEESRGGDLGQTETSRLHRYGWRQDFRWQSPWKPLSLLAGWDIAGVTASWDGHLPDTRQIPSWASLPWVNLDLPYIDVDPSRTWADGDVYLEARVHEWLKRLDLRAGLRWTVLGPTGEQLPSPRVGASLALTPTTRLRSGFGIYWQPVIDPLVWDEEYGNPSVGAERAVHFLLGVEQILPLPLLLRVEGYYRALDRLVVHPDTAEALEEEVPYSNDGEGYAAGFDAVAGFRRGRFSSQAGYSLCISRRYNPRNQLQPQWVSASRDQRHTVHLQGSVELGPTRRWTVALSYDLHSGRPVSEITWAPAADGDSWAFALGEINAERYSWFHELNLRVEHRTEFRHFRLTAYLEVLNAYFAQSEFMYIYSAPETVAEGEPTRSVFRYLPVRPWFGFRGEF